MTDWLNADFFTALVIFYLINAVPSALFGVALARRSGRPWWHGLLPAFFLPWFGLLFLTRQPVGEGYLTGPARYSMVMLFVAGIMVFISIWLPWISGDGQTNGQSGAFEYSPNEAVFVAILIWLLALGLLLSSIGLLFRGGFAVALATGILVSVIGGILTATVYLFGPAGLFLSEARFGDAGTELNVDVGTGGWIALVALITAYVSVLVVPFGLKVRPVPVEPPPLPQPQQVQGPPQWGGQQPPSQWGVAPDRRPPRPGATW